MAYADQLVQWAKRAEAAGYFEDVWWTDPDRDEIQGVALQRRTHEAIAAWAKTTAYDAPAVERAA